MVGLTASALDLADLFFYRQSKLLQGVFKIQQIRRSLDAEIINIDFFFEGIRGWRDDIVKQVPELFGRFMQNIII